MVVPKLATGVTGVTLLVLVIDAALERLQVRPLAWRPLARALGLLAHESSIE